MKLVFTAIDGILCPYSWIDKNIDDYSELQVPRLAPETMQIFSAFCEKNQVNVVVFDKKCYQIEALLKEFYNFPKMLEFSAFYNIEKNEINELIQERINYHSQFNTVEYVIFNSSNLNNSNDGYYQLDRKFQDHTIIVDPNEGITQKQLDRASEILQYIK